MFGESDSESPRLSSPWEAFSASPSPCPGLSSSISSSVSSSDIEAELARRLQTEVPRLVPEVEEVSHYDSILVSRILSHKSCLGECGIQA
jgi:hypothetical protein